MGKLAVMLWVAGLFVLGGCPQKPARPAAPAEPAEPLGVGDRVPDALVTPVAGPRVSLAELVRRKPTVLIFYRGGWCPFCSRHLAEVGQVQDDLEKLGYQILAISPDHAGNAADTAAKLKVTYTLLSDSDMTAARAFGLAFKVDDKLVERYLTEYRIDLEAASGRTHHLLPVPAAYVVDAAGVIRFAHADANYKLRISGAALLAAAKKAASG